MDDNTPTTRFGRIGRLPVAGLVSTLVGRVLLLAVVGIAVFLALYQPSWAINPLRSVAERALEAFGAGLIIVVLWAAAFVLILRYRALALLRHWRLVLGSAALAVAAMGILAYFDGPLPLLDRSNLGGEYGLNILGGTTALSYAKVIVVTALGLWLVASSGVGPLSGERMDTFLHHAKRTLRVVGLGLRALGVGTAQSLRLGFLVGRGAGSGAVRTYERHPIHKSAAKGARRAVEAVQEQRRGKARKAKDELFAREVGQLLTGGQLEPLSEPNPRPQAALEAKSAHRVSVKPAREASPSAMPMDDQEPVPVASPTNIVVTARPANPDRPRSAKWTLPPTELFAPGEASRITGDESTSTAQLIETTLSQHGVEVEVAEVRPGPTVTMYGLVPGWNRRFRNENTTDAAGNLVLDERGRPLKSRAESKNRVKVDSILAREKDLALALAAPSLRIEAPVPGESVVGVEVPNHSPKVVTIRSIMESDTYHNLAQANGLPVALGQASLGEMVAIDLLKMPHLLIAGATGSGKSVCIHSIIASIAAHQHPSKVRMLLIDPKRVELAPYNGIPHLVTPVVTEADRVVRLLKAAVHEMLRRYQLMEKAGVRNIISYNASPRATETIPYFVICVDELADLMMASSYDIEQTICRLAQLGRATGIHMVVATQRPSVDVVTGLIKANFPSRISFAVASQVDSRTILDSVGAERLLGRGDMLFLSSDAPKPRRVQGSFISEEETEALAEHWREQDGPPPPEMPLEEMARVADLATASAAVDDGDGDGPHDTLFEKAAELASRYNQLSTSLLQRRLRIGYPRAARLMDQLEDEDIVSAGEPGKPRDVL